MEYNTARSRLILPEYGRTVQKIAEHLTTITDRDERNRAANALINIMAQVNPQPRDAADYKQKLWDHLYYLTDFNLDVDSPYEKPVRGSGLFTKPKPIPYSNNRIRFKHYGKNVEKMLAHASKMENGPEKDAFVNALASYMKMAYWMWNNDKAPDTVVIDHIRELTHGKVELKAINEFAAHNESYSQKNRKENQGGKQQNFRNKNNNQGNPNNKNNNQGGQNNKNNKNNNQGGPNRNRNNNKQQRNNK